jgi:FkbM family methyltransferase
MRRLTLRNLIGFGTRYRNWWEVARKFRREEPIERLVLWDGLEFRARNLSGAQMLVLFNEVWHGDIYRIADPKSPFHIGAGDSVVDVGANIGLFAIKAARLARGGRVVAVEPDPDNFALLTEHLARSGLANVEVKKAAVSRAPGKAVLVQGFVNSALADVLPGGQRPAGAGRLAEAEAVTLAGLLEEFRLARVDYLKMDVEGSEWDIFESADAATWARVRRVVVEYHDGLRPGCSRLLLGRLQAAGFLTEAEGLNDEQGVGLIYARRP